MKGGKKVGVRQGGRTRIARTIVQHPRTEKADKPRKHGGTQSEKDNTKSSVTIYIHAQVATYSTSNMDLHQVGLDTVGKESPNEASRVVRTSAATQPTLHRPLN